MKLCIRPVTIVTCTFNSFCLNSFREFLFLHRNLSPNDKYYCHKRCVTLQIHTNLNGMSAWTLTQIFIYQPQIADSYYTGEKRIENVILMLKEGVDSVRREVF